MMFNNNMNDFHESPLGQINTDPRAFMANCCTSSWSWFSSLFPSLDGVYALYVFLLHATLCWRLIFDTVWIYKMVYRTLARIIVIPNTLLIKLYEIPYGKYHFQICTKFEILIPYHFSNMWINQFLISRFVWIECICNGIKIYVLKLPSISIVEIRTI